MSEITYEKDRMKELITANNSLVDEVRGQRAEVERLDKRANSLEKTALKIAGQRDKAQATNAELVGALGALLDDSENRLKRGNAGQVLCSTYQSIVHAKARATLAKAKGKETLPCGKEPYRPHSECPDFEPKGNGGVNKEE